eukprot:TRINITY_DN36108_c0_g1_i1.p2 TRINITY_DN36108_c0_g1~~TRINITY_DN36108_c0_g1_i1.p2  ORF type:complete len:101 (-),score=0.37 TRINITY_DN36108_c0_g1_i1:547-849(-)
MSSSISTCSVMYLIKPPTSRALRAHVVENYIFERYLAQWSLPVRDYRIVLLTRWGGGRYSTSKSLMLRRYCFFITWRSVADRSSRCSRSLYSSVLYCMHR